MKIVKTQFTAKMRKLSAEWTVEKSQDLEHVLSDTLREEIDREIVGQITLENLKEQGWYRVDIGPDHGIITDEWCATYLSDEYWHFNSRIWMFKSSEDAVRFALEWS